jgi:histidinol phosphatase-like enzyme
MLLEALVDFGAQAANTPFIGDMPRDMQAAYNAGCQRIMVQTGKGAHSIAQNLHAEFAPVTICADLFSAAEYMLASG